MDKERYEEIAKVYTSDIIGEYARMVSVNVVNALSTIDHDDKREACTLAQERIDSITAIVCAIVNPDMTQWIDCIRTNAIIAIDKHRYKVEG